MTVEHDPDDLEKAAAQLAALVGARDELDEDAEHDARLVRLIRVRRRVGDGSIDSPIRVVVTYHALDGALVHTDDPRAEDDPRVELLQRALGEALKVLNGLAPPYNHTREDGPDSPCPECVERGRIVARARKLEKLTDPDWRPA